MEDLKVGDWVTSYTAGIWQVYRIVDDFYELRWNLNEEKKKSDRKLIFSKRLFNSKWNRSFGSESCHHVFVDLLDKESLERIHSELNNNKKLMDAFAKYKPKESNLMASINFGMPDNYNYERFVSEVDILFKDVIVEGMRMDDILATLMKSDLFQFKGKLPQNSRIQFICQDYEICKSELIFRKYRVFNF